ncbi:hypothetical protein ACFQ3Z_03750 [Streptomyces nogalater]
MHRTRAATPSSSRTAPAPSPRTAGSHGGTHPDDAKPRTLAPAAVVRTAPAATVAVVSLPFFTPFATCYPAVLITRRLRQLGCRARFLPAHMEFYAFARGRGLPESAYKLFTNRHFASDVALLPLWSPPTSAHRAERAELARTEILAGTADEARLRELFDAYLDRLAERLADTEVLCLTSTHFQLLPSLLLARRVARAARNRGAPAARGVRGLLRLPAGRPGRPRPARGGGRGGVRGGRGRPR